MSDNKKKTRQGQNLIRPDQKKDAKSNLVKEGNKDFRSGNYLMIVAIAVLAIVIIVNALVSAIPKKYIRYDLSSLKVFTISDTTKDILKKLDKDVTITTLAEYGSENDYVKNMIQLYANESKHVKLETVDPIANPDFIENKVQANVSQGSLFIQCGDLSEVIELSDMFVDTEDNNGETITGSGMDIEAQVTSAIVHVSSEDTKQAYILGGHTASKSYATVDDSMLTAAKKQNVNIHNFDITSEEYAGKLPEDCDVLILNSIDTDFSEEEMNNILAFLKEGGDMVVFTSTDVQDNDLLPNFNTILEYYGVSVETGAVIERDSNQMLNSDKPYNIVPKMNAHDITNSIIKEEEKLLMPMAASLEVSDNLRSSEKVSVLLNTSESAYFKKNGSSTMSKTDSDKSGIFNVGIALTDKVNDDKETNIAIFSSAAMLNPGMDEEVNGANAELFSNAINWASGNTQNIYIPIKSIYPADLVLTSRQIAVVTILVAIVIPVLVLVYGLFVWIKRRRK